jgi:hypothetical protein
LDYSKFSDDPKLVNHTIENIETKELNDLVEVNFEDFLSVV